MASRESTLCATGMRICWKGATRVLEQSEGTSINLLWPREPGISSVVLHVISATVATRCRLFFRGRPFPRMMALHRLCVWLQRSQLAAGNTVLPFSLSWRFHPYCQVTACFQLVHCFRNIYHMEVYEQQRYWLAPVGQLSSVYDRWALLAQVFTSLSGIPWVRIRRTSFNGFYFSLEKCGHFL